MPNGTVSYFVEYVKHAIDPGSLSGEMIVFKGAWKLQYS